VLIGSVALTGFFYSKKESEGPQGENEDEDEA
jgi:hypothetical protein